MRAQLAVSHFHCFRRTEKVLPEDVLKGWSLSPEVLSGHGILSELLPNAVGKRQVADELNAGVVWPLTES